MRTTKKTMIEVEDGDLVEIRCGDIVITIGEDVVIDHERGGPKLAFMEDPGDKPRIFMHQRLGNVSIESPQGRVVTEYSAEDDLEYVFS